MTLYRGPLLASISSYWVDTFRESYQERALMATLRLAELTAADDVSRSDALAEQVLLCQPDNEAAYERLIANALKARDQVGLRQVLSRYEQARRQAGLLERVSGPRRPR